MLASIRHLRRRAAAPHSRSRPGDFSNSTCFGAGTGPLECAKAHQIRDDRSIPSRFCLDRRSEPWRTSRRPRPSSASVGIPMIVARGVRSSWLALATKSVASARGTKRTGRPVGPARFASIAGDARFHGRRSADADDFQIFLRAP